MFNTLRYARKLEDVGFTRAQAEANIQIIAEIIEGDVATKQDIKELRKDLERKIESSEHRLLIKLSAVMASLFTIAIAVLAFMLQQH